MAHFDKHKMSACGHLCKHYERGKDESNNYVKFGNMDINPQLTPLNYNLAPVRNQGHFGYIKHRLGEVRLHKRLDVNVMCSWVVTAPRDLLENEYRRFFEESYNFLEQRYGKENVISSYVHMDEITPHMHFAFIPVAIDKKKKIEKVSAKERINKFELKSFHGDLSAHMENVFNRDIGILNGATKEGNHSIDELKRKSATERLQDVALKGREMFSSAKKEVREVRNTLMGVNAEYEAKKAYIGACDKESKVSETVPDYAKVKKSLLGKVETITVPREKWEQKHVSENEKSFLRNATEKFEKAVEAFSKTSSAEHMANLENKIADLESQLYLAKKDNLEAKRSLKKACCEVEDLVGKINSVLNKLPDELAHQFLQIWNAEKNLNKKRDKGIER